MVGAYTYTARLEVADSNCAQNCRQLRVSSSHTQSCSWTSVVAQTPPIMSRTCIEVFYTIRVLCTPP